jgi:basic membrane lipoprotein Med (substrate-binding protein (PBP1-ABC) superfamily)
MPSIAAEVTRVVPPKGMGLDDELDRYEEFERFYRVAPLYDFVPSRLGDYGRLARALGRDLAMPWPTDDVRKLKATLSLFHDVLARLGADALGCSPSDAFVLYVTTYAGCEPLDVTHALLMARVRRLWPDLVVASKSDALAFVDDPGGLDKGVVRRVVSMVRPSKAIRVGFVYDRSPASSGWCALHDTARLQLSDRTRGVVETVAFEGRASDEAFEEALREAQEAGCSAVVTISPRQLAQTTRAAVEHPTLSFANCSVNLPRGSVQTFYARMYEVKFLMGALAASRSRSHQLGYLAFSPIYGSVAEVNAFALGAALIDPTATVHLMWLSATKGWQDQLVDAGVDVVADRDFLDPTAPDEPWGLYALDDGRVVPIGTPVWDWARYYELLCASLGHDVAGTSQRRAQGRAINYWWGMKAGVVRFELAGAVAAGHKRLHDMLAHAIVEGWVSPFDTKLIDQSGVVVRGEGDAPLTDAQIAEMRWLNNNVVGSLPQAAELSAGGRADVEAAGIVSVDVQESLR